MVCDTASSREKKANKSRQQQQHRKAESAAARMTWDVKFETVTNTRFVDPDEIDTCDFQFPFYSKAFNAISVVQFFQAVLWVLFDFDEGE